MRSPGEDLSREDAQIDMCLNNLDTVNSLDEGQLRYLSVLIEEKIGGTEDPQEKRKYEILLTAISQYLQ